MAKRKFTPEANTKCVVCGQPVYESVAFVYTKCRGGLPTFAHKFCYDKLIQRRDVDTGATSDRDKKRT